MYSSACIEWLAKGNAENLCDHLRTLKVCRSHVIVKIERFILAVNPLAHRILYAFLITLSMKHAVWHQKAQHLEPLCYLFLIESG